MANLIRKSLIIELKEKPCGVEYMDLYLAMTQAKKNKVMKTIKKNSKRVPKSMRRKEIQRPTGKTSNLPSDLSNLNLVISRNINPIYLQ